MRRRVNDIFDPKLFVDECGEKSANSIKIILRSIQKNISELSRAKSLLENRSFSI